MSRKTLVILVLPLLATICLILFVFVVRDQLPERVAIHWSGGGIADGFTNRDTLPLLLGFLTLMVVGPLSLVGLISGKSIVGTRLLQALPMATVSFLATILVSTVVVQLNTYLVPPLPGWAIPVGLLAALVGGVVAFIIAGPASAVPTTRATAPPEAPRIELPAGHTAVWAGRTPMATVMIVGSFLTALLAVALGIFASWWLLCMFVPVIVLLLSSAVYNVTVGPHGLRVAGLFLGFPRVQVPLDQVTSAEAGTVDAMNFGGWGIRINTAGESAVITKSGSALIVNRTDGAVLRVSLDAPQEVVAVLSTLLDKRSA